MTDAIEALKHIEIVRTALKEQAKSKCEWQPIDTAPSYEFGNENTEDYVIRAIGCDTGRVINAIGHFKEDGFYLQEGGELSYAFTPTHWMPLPEPPREKTNEKDF